MGSLDTPEMHDASVSDATFLQDVLEGLGSRPKTLPSKYFYDQRGSQLFDDICEQPEYYPTRTELAIMEENADTIAESLGEGVLLIELGSGSSVKTRLLLDHLQDMAGYIPLDISLEHLRMTAEAINQDYPGLEVLPVCADYLQDFFVPEPAKPVEHRVVYFPGSTIGNLTPELAHELLSRAARVCGPEGSMLIGVDLKKDPAVLEAAYSDAAGVTADFNYNLLHRINNELGANFDPGAFKHEAVYNAGMSRVESHLVSERAQEVTIDGETFSFDAGESIHTENSHKYSLEDFAAIAGKAGFKVQCVWTDPKDLFSVQMLVPVS
jgi:dimethylhistidine N-methyltransferase